MIMDLDRDLIVKQLSGKTVGRDVRLLDAVPSTNGALRLLAQQGAPEGTVVVADEQTAGQGRLRKLWFSPPAVNVYASVLLRPPIPPREVPGYSFISSLALTDAIQAEGLPHGPRDHAAPPPPPAPQPAAPRRRDPGGGPRRGADERVARHQLAGAHRRDPGGGARAGHQVAERRARRAAQGRRQPRGGRDEHVVRPLDE